MGDLSKKVGRRIKKIREANKIKQYALAEMLGMEPSNLTRIESGLQLPKEENLLKIADILHVEVKDLFEFNEEKTTDEIKDKTIQIISNLNSDEIGFVYEFLKLYKNFKL